MFDFALPRLRDDGVKKFALEVIQTNGPAVKAYLNSGFSIVREFDCFELEVRKAVPLRNKDSFGTIGQVGLEALPQLRDSLDWEPSWENGFSAIERIPDDVLLLGAVNEGECFGLLVYGPFLNWIMTLVVKRDWRRKGVASHLLAHLLSVLPDGISMVKLQNVDHSDTVMRKFLEKAGFELVFKQYEMEIIL